MMPSINGANALPNNWAYLSTGLQYFPSLGDAALYAKGTTGKQFQNIIITSATAVKVYSREVTLLKMKLTSQ